jgi:hypothetical protein
MKVIGITPRVAEPLAETGRSTASIRHFASEALSTNRLAGDPPLQACAFSGKTETWGVGQSRRSEIPGTEPPSLMLAKPDA